MTCSTRHPQGPAREHRTQGVRQGQYVRNAADFCRAFSKREIAQDIDFQIAKTWNVRQRRPAGHLG